MIRLQTTLLLAFVSIASTHKGHPREMLPKDKTSLINRILQDVDGSQMSEERLKSLSYILRLQKPNHQRLQLTNRQTERQSIEEAVINGLKGGGRSKDNDSSRRHLYKNYHRSRDRGRQAIALAAGAASNLPFLKGPELSGPPLPLSRYNLEGVGAPSGESTQQRWPDPWEKDFQNYDEDNYVSETSDYYGPFDMSDYTYEQYDVEDLNYEEYVYYPHEEVCQTRKTWILLNETINQRGQPVRVLPNTNDGNPQYVYIYQCKQSQCKRCKGVQQNSRCVMKESFLKLYHELLDMENFGLIKYDYVSVPTHCTCELLPENFYDRSCYKKGKRRN